MASSHATAAATRPHPGAGVVASPDELLRQAELRREAVRRDIAAMLLAHAGAHVKAAGAFADLAQWAADHGPSMMSKAVVAGIYAMHESLMALIAEIPALVETGSADAHEAILSMLRTHAGHLSAAFPSTTTASPQDSALCWAVQRYVVAACVR